MEYRPPKDRKNVYLYMSYIHYREISEFKKRHMNRVSAMRQGRSNMDLPYELSFVEAIDLEGQKKLAGKMMASNGTLTGPIWAWITNIKGLGSGVFAAQLIAEIDDISKFDTISKLWRFAGYAVFEGKAEPRGKYKAPHDEEEKRHYNGRLKGLLYNIVGSFLKSQSPYADVYYEYKARQRERYPVPICRTCKVECVSKKKNGRNGNEFNSFRCPNNAKHVKDYSDSHLHLRAIRKTVGVFLKDLWLEWRRLENLPITEEWEG